MDPKHLALAHGEKAVVLLIAAFCGWTVWSAFTDKGIRPAGEGVTQQSIGAEIDDINRRMGSKDVPTLEAPKSYVQAMNDRFSVSIPRPQRMSWLFAHPDIDGSVSAGPYLYCYEIYQPKVTAADEIGKVILTLTPPDGVIHEEAPDPGAAPPTITPMRHSALLDFRQSRSTERGEIVNSAQVLGLQIEMAVGQEGWHPLTVENQISDGFVPLAALSGRGGASYKFKSTATWQEVRFRTRTVVKATGFTGDPLSDQTILMHQGYWPEPKDWKQLDRDLKADPVAFMKPFLQPDDANPPPGVALAKGEHLYYSDWNDPPEARAIITDEVRFAFTHYDATTGVATFLVSKQFAGGQWLAKAQPFKVKPNDKIGDMVHGIPTPLDKPSMVRDVDLSTPFRLKEVKPEQERTLFWGVRVVTDPTANPGGHAHRKLVLDAVKKKVDVAILQNTKTGDEVPCACLEHIDRPEVRRFPAFYPILPQKHTDEQHEFEKSPAGYIELPMDAAQPKELDPKDPDGPLAKLHNSDLPYAGQATSDVPYYLFPDGRLVWLNEENYQSHGVFQYPEPKIPDEAPPTAAHPTPAAPHSPSPPVPPRMPTPPTGSGGHTNEHGPPPPQPGQGGGGSFQGPPPGVGPPGGFGGGGPGGGAGGGGGQVPSGGGYGR